jgi:hypothetical protein
MHKCRAWAILSMLTSICVHPPSSIVVFTLLCGNLYGDSQNRYAEKPATFVESRKQRGSPQTNLMWHEVHASHFLGNSNILIELVVLCYTFIQLKESRRGSHVHCLLIITLERAVKVNHNYAQYNIRAYVHEKWGYLTRKSSKQIIQCIKTFGTRWSNR